ncbi:hypothetical protein [Myroides pelagicus]|uniref:Uncharacterized protein n=1 Tax=Myroides pelagicus TaxID=270914 RepID=A0A7K1GHB0_9FLAO|nr:hypothetical protein [Myroides pelagicus]MEC4113481.1 hypothetical protein [Myroides pelagicus]MTH28318.1 hypothetical protein [Myroides pelagicus]
MQDSEKELLKKRTKRAILIDITLFVLCTINLTLWLIRASYVTGVMDHSVAIWVYEQLFTPMYYALYALPILLVLSFINRRITFDSFSFLSVKCLAITYFLIFTVS